MTDQSHMHKVRNLLDTRVLFLVAFYILLSTLYQHSPLAASGGFIRP